MTHEHREVPNDALSELDETIRRSLDRSSAGVGEITAGELAALLGDRAESGDAAGRRPSGGRPTARPGRDPRRWLAVAAALTVVAGMLGTYLLLRGESDPPVTNVADGDGVSNGFDSWSPGWHELDRGPVPGFVSASLAWFDGHLVVAGGLWVEQDADSGSSDWVTSQWAYDPQRRNWGELAAPPFEIDSMVVSDRVLVAVGSPPGQSDRPRADREYRWATLDSIDQQWVDRGGLDGLIGTEMRPYMRTSLEGSDILVNTGRHVIDFSQGSVLDPSAGDSMPLGPPELEGSPPNSYLPPLVQPVAMRLGGESGTSAVWPPAPTGDQHGSAEVFSDDLLIWDAVGQRLDRVEVSRSESTGSDSPRAGSMPSVPIKGDGDGDDAQPDRWTTVVVDGRVLLIGVEGPALDSAYSFDPRTGAVDAIASIGGTIGSSATGGEQRCYFAQASSTGDVVAMPCDTTTPGAVPLVMQDGEWSATPDLPSRVDRAARVRSWLMMEPAGDAIVIWSTMDRPQPYDESVYVPEASDPWALVWVPGPSESDRGSNRGSATMPDRIESGSSQKSDACVVDDLPDIAFALDGRFNPLPLAGIGGLGDVDETEPPMPPGSDTSVVDAVCARYWVAADDPGTHVTQYVGRPSGVAPGTGETVGPYEVYPIHEGFVIEHRDLDGDADWSLVLYGLGADEVNKIAEQLPA